jgi:hypothetical protein
MPASSKSSDGHDGDDAAEEDGTLVPSPTTLASAGTAGSAASMTAADQPIEVVVFKVKATRTGELHPLPSQFVRDVFLLPSATVETLKKKILQTAQKEGVEAPAVNSMHLFVRRRLVTPFIGSSNSSSSSSGGGSISSSSGSSSRDGAIGSAGTGAGGGGGGGGGGGTGGGGGDGTATSSAEDPGPPGKLSEFLELGDKDKPLSEYLSPGALQLQVYLKDKTWLQTTLDVLLFALYVALNIGINLYNKWMFSVQDFRIPLLNLVCHQFAIFLAVLFFVLLYMCTGFGVKLVPVRLSRVRARGRARVEWEGERGWR